MTWNRCNFKGCIETEGTKPFMALGFMCAKHRQELRESMSSYLTQRMGKGYTVTVTTPEDRPDTEGEQDG